MNSESRKVEDAQMTAEEFIATTDLSNPQLYELHNKCEGFLPKPLLAAALKHLVQLTTVRCLQISRIHQQSIFGRAKSVELSSVLI